MHPNVISNPLSRKLGRRLRSGQSPEMLTVVPGTEILPNDATLQSPSLTEEFLENREKMAALKDSLLSAHSEPVESGSKMGLENLMDAADINAVSAKANEVVSDIFNSFMEQSLTAKSNGLDFGKFAASKMTSIMESIGSDASTVVSNARSYVGEQTTVLSDAIYNGEENISNMLPPELKVASLKAADLMKDAIEICRQNPEGYAIVFSLGFGIPLLLTLSSMYGGFDGFFKPSEVMEILQDSDSILIDIRTKEERMRNGVPLLKLAARGKGVAIPYPTLSSALAKKVFNSRDLSIEILSAQIRSVAKINRKTRVILMDNGGEMAKEVARACKKVGLSRVFVMEGGFNRFGQQGLQIDSKDYYEDGPLAIVADTAESLKLETEMVFGKSGNVAITLTGVVVLTLVLTNLHEVLKFVGVLGLELTFLLRYIIGDENIGDDFRNLSSTFQSIYPRELTSGLNSSQFKRGNARE